MTPFVYTQLPGRVVFGAGSLDELPREIGLLGAKRALVLSTPEQTAQAEDVAKRLGERCAGIFPRAVMHVPIETARAAREEALRARRRLLRSRSAAARPPASARRSRSSRRCRSSRSRPPMPAPR